MQSDIWKMDTWENFKVKVIGGKMDQREQREEEKGGQMRRE